MSTAHASLSAEHPVVRRRIIILVSCFVTTMGCAKPTDTRPHFVINDNDHVNEIILRHTEPLEPKHERLAGGWKVRQNSAENRPLHLSLDFRPFVLGGASRSPDGYCSLGSRGGNLKYEGYSMLDIRLDRDNKVIRFYEVGAIKEDGTPFTKEIGTATLIGEDWLRVQGAFVLAGEVLDLNVVFVRGNDKK